MLEKQTNIWKWGQPLISVIVPIYKAEQYIDCYVDSILR